MLATRPQANFPFLSRMEAPLLALSPKDAWRVRDSFESVQIFGSVGSGKTSGSGRAVAHSYLKAGYGGLVCCAMPSERALWERYAAECGRSNSVIVFDGSGDRRINFLDYELARSDRDTGTTFNAVRLLAHILDVASGKSAARTTENPFWREAMGQLLTNTIMPLHAARDTITLSSIMRMINQRPRSLEQMRTPGWTDGSFWGRTMRRAWKRPRRPMPDPDYQAMHEWWTQVFVEGNNRTSSDVITTVSAKLAPFLTGKMREIFATDTNIAPELTHEGAIIILDFPIPTWDETGILAQQVFKYLWQRSIERRQLDEMTRPCFLYADECQYFLSPHDPEYQAIARQKRASTVYITQNLPTYYDRIGAENPEAAADRLLGNFQTKIFHTNSCVKTNQYAADLIGKAVVWRRNVSQGRNTGWTDSTSTGETGGTSTGTNRSRGNSSGDNRSWGRGWSGGQGGGMGWNSNNSYGTNTGENESSGVNSSANRGWSTGRTTGTSGGDSETLGANETIDYQVQPSFFTTLRNGGDANGKQVDALLYQGGRVWLHSKSTFLPCTFPQS